ncbi:MAG: efflux RND transporter periplasmic adaptor subunit [Burkholderiaceae bacterium]
MKPSKMLLSITSALAVGLGVGIPAMTTAQSQATPRGLEIPARKVSQTAPVRAKTARQASKDFGCLIQPYSSAEVAASAPGVLAEVRVDRGDEVRRGQILAVLDTGVEQALLAAAKERASARAEVAAARATHQIATKKLERMRALNKLSYSARLEMELAQGELEVSKYRIEQARERHKIAKREHRVASSQLEQRYVRSPIDGVVADRLLNPGERADGRPIARVIRLDQLRVEVIAPAKRYGLIKPGMFGQIRTQTEKPIKFTAIVDQVDSFIDPASGTFRARMLLDNQALAVPAGARCEITFETGSADADKG